MVSKRIAVARGIGGVEAWFRLLSIEICGLLGCWVAKNGSIGYVRLAKTGGKERVV